MQALINSSGFVQCWCISNRVHKPMSMCYLSDFLIDCSENRGVKKIYKRNSKAITQFFDGWNGDALLGGIKHTVNGGRSDTGTDSKGIGTSSVANIICLFSFFVDISGNRLFLCTVRRILRNDNSEDLTRKSTDRKIRKGILHTVNGRKRSINYVLSKSFWICDHQSPLKSFRKHDLFLVVCVSYQNEHIFLT